MQASVKDSPMPRTSFIARWTASPGAWRSRRRLLPTFVVALTSTALIVAAGAVDTVASPAPASPSASVTFSHVGYVGGAFTGVVVAGDRAFVGNGVRLEVYDASGGTFRYLGQSDPLEGLVTVEAVDGAYAYVTENAVDPVDPSGADRELTLHVANLDDARHPAWRGSVKLGGEYDLRSAAARGGWVFAAMDHAGLAVFDARDPGAIRRVSTVDMRGLVADVEFLGHYLLVALSTGTTGRLVVLDLVDPAHPVELSRLDLASSIQALAVSGQRVLAVGRSLFVVDASDPSQPVVIGEEAILAVDVAWSGDRVYFRRMAGSDLFVFPYIQSYDASNLPHLRLQAELSLGALSLDPVGDMLVVADVFVGLRLLTLNPAGDALVDADRVPAIAFPAAPVISGHDAYVVSHDVLWVVDMSDPQAPQVAGRTGVSVPQSSEECAFGFFGAAGLTVAGGYAYIVKGASVCEGGVAIVDISDPAMPRQVGSWNPALDPALQPELVYRLTMNEPAPPVLYGDRLLVTSEGYLIELDVSDPSAPRYRRSFMGYPPPNMYPIDTVALDGQTAWLSIDDLGVSHVDLSGTDIRDIAAIQTDTQTRGVAVVGDYVLVGIHSLGLAVISRRRHTVVANDDSIIVDHFSVSGSTTYVWGSTYRDDEFGPSGLLAVDLRDPRRPTLVGEHPLPHLNYDVEGPPVPFDGHVLISAGRYGLEVLRENRVGFPPTPTPTTTATPRPTVTATLPPPPTATPAPPAGSVFAFLPLVRRLR
jgi:hypothetical protein